MLIPIEQTQNLLLHRKQYQICLDHLMIFPEISEPPIVTQSTSRRQKPLPPPREKTPRDRRAPGWHHDYVAHMVIFNEPETY
jgi:hypothetical protein